MVFECFHLIFSPQTDTSTKEETSAPNRFELGFEMLEHTEYGMPFDHMSTVGGGSDDGEEQLEPLWDGAAPVWRRHN